MSQHDEYIKDNYLLLPLKEIAATIGKDKPYVQRRLRKMGLQVPKDIANARKAEALKEKYKYSWAPVDEVIKEQYLQMPVKQLCKQLGKSSTWLKHRMALLGLKVPKEIAEARKAATQVKKGNIPFNKGKKAESYMSKEQLEIFRKNQFAVGNEPHNTKEDGAITIRNTGRSCKNKPYKFIRIAKGQWEMLHVKMWREAKGEIPKGHVIYFKNGDAMDVRLDNLECISRGELAQRNRGRDYPKELKEAITVLNKLKKAIHEKHNSRPT